MDLRVHANIVFESGVGLQRLKTAQPGKSRQIRSAESDHLIKCSDQLGNFIFVRVVNET